MEARSTYLSEIFSPFLRSNILAPGYTSGPFWMSFIKKSRFLSFTVIGLVIFIAIFLGTPSCLIDKLGSPVITERALKSTRFPMRLPRIRPLFEFNLPIMHWRGRPDRCAIGTAPLTLLFTIIATKYCNTVVRPSITLGDALFAIFSARSLFVLIILL